MKYTFKVYVSIFIIFIMIIITIFSVYYLRNISTDSSLVFSLSVQNPVTHVAVSSDNTYIVASDYDRENSTSHVYVWKNNERSLIQTISQNCLITSLATRPNSDELFIALSDGSFKMFHLQTGALINEFVSAPSSHVISTCNIDKIDVSRHRIIQDIAFHPQKNIIAVSCSDGTMLLLDTQSGELLKEVHIRDRDPLVSIAFNTEGNMVAIGDIFANIYYYGLEDHSLQYIKLVGGEIPVSEITFDSKNQRFLAVLDWNGSEIWSVTRNDRHNLGSPKYFGRLAFNANADSVVTSSYPGRGITLSNYDTDIHLCSVKQLDSCTTLRGHTEYITDLQFSLDGKWVISGGHDATVKVWRVPN